ncbi:O-unit flippase [Clostridium perfringens]|nr:O-unit flippase [Clostridium perfringens]
MRVRKSLINSIVAMISYIISFIPVFILRKVFVENLGGELLGLSSLYTNIIGYISVIEMGIGSAIIYSLYKPFAENNKEKIKGFLMYYNKFYKVIGFIVLLIGLFITPIIHFFINDNINLNLVRIGFILFLLNTFIGYMFTYKHCLLNVAQEGYKVSLGITISKILIAICQCYVVVKYKSFYGYIIVQIIINLIFYFLMNIYIDKEFYWLKEAKGNIDLEEKKSLIKNIKALFYHKIGSVFVFGTDNIIVSSFINLKVVAIYNNYIIITNAFSGILGHTLNGLTASIGNLLVENNDDYIYIIHKRIFFMNFWLASFIIISLFNTINHFIGLWIGYIYILDMVTVALILINSYFQMMRGSVEQFKNASGQYYQDRYAPICEGIINLIVSILLVNIIGLPGVLIGTLISNLGVIFWVKPKIVYKYVFDKPLINYFKMYFKYLSIAFIPLLLTMFLTSDLKQNITIEAFIINCLINIVVINLFYLIVFWKNENFVYFKNIALNLIKRTKKSERVC